MGGEGDICPLGVGSGGTKMNNKMGAFEQEKGPGKNFDQYLKGFGGSPSKKKKVRRKYQNTFLISKMF